MEHLDSNSEKGGQLFGSTTEKRVNWWFSVQQLGRDGFGPPKMGVASAPERLFFLWISAVCCRYCWLVKVLRLWKGFHYDFAPSNPPISLRFTPSNRMETLAKPSWKIPWNSMKKPWLNHPFQYHYMIKVNPMVSGNQCIFKVIPYIFSGSFIWYTFHKTILSRGKSPEKTHCVTLGTFTVTQPEPVLVKGSGGYLVAWHIGRRSPI